MLDQLTRVILDCTRQIANRPVAWAVFARNAVSGFLTTARHVLMILGIIAITALGILFVKPEMISRMKMPPPSAQADAELMGENTNENIPPLARLMDKPAPSIIQAAAQGQSTADKEDGKTASTSREQQRVTNWIAKRYRVATEATDMLVSATYLIAKEMKIDPLLILSVMAIESRFNPFAESPVGAQGLMQVMSKVHRDKFKDLGGVEAALNPLANIQVGAMILKEYVKRGGSVEAGLKLYVGAGALESDSGYGAKVLAEYRRLQDVAMGKKVSIYSPSMTTAAATPKPAAAQEPKINATSEETAALSEQTKQQTEQQAEQQTEQQAEQQTELLPAEKNLAAL